MSKYPEFKNDVRRFFNGPGSDTLRGVEITSGPNACDACRSTAGKLFTRTEDVPRLPHSGCVCQPYGCRCVLTPVEEP